MILYLEVTREPREQVPMTGDLRATADAHSHMALLQKECRAASLRIATGFQQVAASTPYVPHQHRMVFTILAL